MARPAPQHQHQQATKRRRKDHCQHGNRDWAPETRPGRHLPPGNTGPHQRNRPADRALCGRHLQSHQPAPLNLCPSLGHHTFAQRYQSGTSQGDRLRLYPALSRHGTGRVTGQRHSAIARCRDDIQPAVTASADRSCQGPQHGVRFLIGRGSDPATRLPAQSLPGATKGLAGRRKGTSYGQYTPARQRAQYTQTKWA